MDTVNLTYDLVELVGYVELARLKENLEKTGSSIGLAIVGGKIPDKSSLPNTAIYVASSGIYTLYAWSTNPTRMHVEYSSRNTWKLIEELLEEAELYTIVSDWRNDLGDFSANSMRTFCMCHEDMYRLIDTPMEDVNWSEVAKEINAN